MNMPWLCNLVHNVINLSLLTCEALRYSRPHSSIESIALIINLTSFNKLKLIARLSCWRHWPSLLDSIFLSSLIFCSKSLLPVPISFGAALSKPLNLRPGPLVRTRFALGARGVARALGNACGVTWGAGAAKNIDLGGSGTDAPRRFLVAK